MGVSEDAFGGYKLQRKVLSSRISTPPHHPFPFMFRCYSFPRFLSFDALSPHGGGGPSRWWWPPTPVSSSSITFACYKEALVWKSTLFFMLQAILLGALLSLDFICSIDGDQATHWHKEYLAICNNTNHSYGKGTLSWNNVRIDVHAIKTTHKLPPFVTPLIYALAFLSRSFPLRSRFVQTPFLFFPINCNLPKNTLHLSPKVHVAM